MALKPCPALAEQEALGAVELDHAGRRAVDAELRLDARARVMRVRLPVRQRCADRASGSARWSCPSTARRSPRRAPARDGSSAPPLVMKIFSPCDDVVVALQRRRACAMLPRSEPACGSVRSIAALELAAGEARQVALPSARRCRTSRCRAPTPGLQADDRHQARVGARDHLEIGAVDQERQAVAAVLGADRQRRRARPPRSFA